MPKFPTLTYRQVIKKIRKVGFCFYRQAKGSHELWVRHSDGRIAVIPRHSGKAIKRKTLKDIINSTGLSIREFTEL